MTPHRSRWTVSRTLAALLVLGLLPLAAAQAAPLRKQLAAPPGEILAGHLRLPDPAAHGQRSTAALLPVRLTGSDGLRQVRVIEVGATPAGAEPRPLRVALLAPVGRQWRLRLVDPRGHEVAPSPRLRTLPGFPDSYRAPAWRVEAPAAGRWRLVVEGSGHAAGEGFLWVDNGAPVGLYSHLEDVRLVLGRELGLRAWAYPAPAAGPGAPSPLGLLEVTARALIQGPDGSRRRVAMTADPARAGVFLLRWRPATAGTHVVRLELRGRTGDGQPVLRTSSHVVPVLAPGPALGRGSARVEADGERMQLVVPAAGADRPVLAAAELWAGDGAGERPLVWLGGMTDVAAGALRLGLDPRWLARAGLGGDEQLFLRRVRIQDPGTAIPYDRRGRMPVELRASLPPAAESVPVVDEMLTGPRPEALRPAVAGGVLMLVHGYCAGSPPWPEEDFTDYAVFSDLDQNRSHDEFARLIMDFGSAWPSFGIVAHSQGGPAAVHLRTYYWSGLDLAEGPRRIQSVGSPYQGTNLAGDLADIGLRLGIGCGSNFDLTYTGAALWLAGIPDWARADTWYATTSFTDRWWAYDYCSLLTDLFLSDPDDGVTEEWAGQLAGANDLGHTTGWCHTTGMRDPAQYLDHVRNQEMNALGAR